MAPDGVLAWSAGQSSRWGPLTGTRPGGPQPRNAPGPDGGGSWRRAIRACSNCVFARLRRAVPVRGPHREDWPALQAFPVIRRDCIFGATGRRFQNVKGYENRFFIQACQAGSSRAAAGASSP